MGNWRGDGGRLCEWENKREWLKITKEGGIKKIVGDYVTGRLVLRIERKLGGLATGVSGVWDPIVILFLFSCPSLYFLFLINSEDFL